MSARSNSLQEIVKLIYKSAISAVKGQNLIKNNIRMMDNKLIVSNEIFMFKNIYLVGFGKAVLGMAEEVESILHEHITKGILSVPFGSVDTLKPKFNDDSKIEIKECAKNNLPDQFSCENARLIQSLVQNCSEDDILIVLISGGGSACLSLPHPSLTLEDKLKTINLLVKTGADIKELNKVRKKISSVKGGQLAIMGYPATIISLIISDVVRDPLSDIASGPTVLNEDDWSEAKNILIKYGLQYQVPENVMKILDTKPHQDQNQMYFKNVHNFLLGNNNLALKSAKLEAERLGFQTIILSNSVEGFGEHICASYVELVKFFAKHRRRWQGRQSKSTDSEDCTKQLEEILLQLHTSNETIHELTTILNKSEKLKLCIINGGEITWDMSNRVVGTGGRNLHLTLQVQYEIGKLFKDLWDQGKMFDVCFSSAGTDGIDGVTDVAGSIASSSSNVDLDSVKHFLDGFDSYNYYVNRMEELIKPGHTGTNVMDVHILILEEL